MNLKKNDKIILIVGVVILLIAGVGIALYTAPDSDDNDIGESNIEKEYKSSWIEYTKELSLTDTMETLRNDPFASTVQVTTPSNSVLTNVVFKFNWMDDRTHGLLIPKGLDTLTFEVSRNGNTKTETSTGEGNHSFSYSINPKPSQDTYQAESEQDAADYFEGQIAGMNAESFDVTVSVDTGERMLRLIKYIRDKGNDFDLTVMYTYYTLEVGMLDTGDDTDDTKTTGGNDDDVATNNHYVGEFYTNLGFGRGMI